ncbi:MAG: LamG-like jellyroll fold domain-containing protein, partial [Candidatus Kariarchaeaceae archaeon]
EFYLTPIFSGGNGTTRLFQNVYTDWTEWVEITNDPNSPSTWTWTDVNQLDVEIKATDPASHDTSLNKLELRIEHGGDYDDSTSNNNGGSDTGSPLAAIGKIGNAIEFTDPGSNQYIAMPNSASLTISNAITLEAWIYPDVVNKWESIVSKMDGTMGSGSGANEDLYWVLDNSGNHFIGLAGASGYTDWSTGIAATANQWQQVTFTYDGSTSIGRLYIDGIEIDNFNYGRGPLMTNTNPFYIGFNRGWTGEVWDGRIDEVRVSNIVRSAEWITTTFNNQQDPHDFYSVSGEMYFKRYTSYEKSITIDNTKVLTDLVDFPVLVSIYDSDLKVKAQYNGFDITFYDASDAQLAHEIESYDPNYNGTHAELVAWVKTDLSSSEDTPIRMKYGDHAKVSQENPTGVWGSEYKGVWHLGDDPSPYYYDSTYNSNDGIASNSPSNITAIIDGGVSFDDTNERGVSVSHSISLQLPSDIMVSAWIRTTDSDGDVGIVINKWGNAASDRNYWLGKLDANDFAFFVDDSQNVKYPLSNFNDGVWHYVVGLAYGSTLALYLDGSLVNSASYDGTSVTGTSQLTIGRSSETITQEFNGDIDETRVIAGARGTGWILTEYNNQKNPDTFLSVSSESEFTEYTEFEKTITIDHNQVSADLDNFPVFISLYDSDLKVKAQSNGFDIEFYDTDGVQLSHEIEVYNPTYNSTHAQLAAWVRANLSSSADTEIVMKYGGPSKLSQEDTIGVWDSNFAGVWHLNNDPSSSLTLDSTSNNNDGTDFGSMTSNDLIDGMTGAALEFDGSNDYISLGNPSSLQITGVITVEAWFKASTIIVNDYIVSKSGGSGNRGWDLSFDDDPGVAPDGWLMFRYTDSTQGGHSEGYERVSVDTWYHVVGVYSPSNFERFYLNGTLISEDTTSIPNSMFDASVNALIGSRSGSAEWFEGIIDEVRISTIARSQDWINTQFSNQMNPNAFYSISVEDKSQIEINWPYAKEIQIDYTKVSEDLTDFPVLISMFDSDLKVKAQADGGDIAFFDTFGARLPHEFEIYDQNFNSTHAQLIAWVRTDLSSTSNTDIIMKYGLPTLNNQEDPTEAWNSDFVGVWHLNEDPSLDLVFDSTANNNDGTSQGSMTSQDSVAGVIGNGLDFDGTNDYIDVGNDASLQLTGAITVEAWFQVPTTVVNDFVVSKSGISGDRGWDINTVAGTAPDGTVRWHFTGPAQAGFYEGSEPITINTWYHVVGVYSPSGHEQLFVNGVLVSEDIAGVPTDMWDSTANVFIAARLTQYFEGKIDEVRISKVSRSSGWVATEFANQDDPSSFYSVSSEIDLTNRVIDARESNIDVSSDLGNGNNFGDLQYFDGSYSTFTESVPSTNTHSLQANAVGYMNIGDTTPNWNSRRGTISYWVYFNAIGANYRPWGSNDLFEMEMTGAQLELDWGTPSGGTALMSSTNFVSGTWYFVAVTWNEDTNTIKMYLGNENSAPVVDAQTTTWTDSISAIGSADNTFLASRGGSSGRVDGSGDDLRYYDTDRTLKEIQSDYNKSLSGSEPHLRSNFKLDGNFADSGPDGNHGSSSGTTVFVTSPRPSFVTSDAQIDFEMQWTSIPYTTATGDLAIYSGTTDAEDLAVEYWDGTSWSLLISDLSPNSWTNTTITSLLIGNQFTIRFKDGTPSSDTNVDSWQIDAVILNLVNYQLDWEHTVNQVDTTKEKFTLAIYGSSSDSSESFEIQMWDADVGDWTSSLMTIGSTEQWYNTSISGSSIIKSSIIWRYIGDNETSDYVQNTLSIDYAGVASYDEAPVITVSPGNYQYSEGDPGNILTWVATDAQPDTYQVLKEGNPVASNSWSSGANIDVNVDGLTKGVYNYTIIVQDQSGIQTTDMIDVAVVDTTDPVFTYTLSNYSFEASSSGNDLDWIVTDNYPSSYWIYRNGSQVDTNTWISASNITYSVDGLLKGLYNFTIEVADDSSNVVNNTVWISVYDSTDPAINNPPDTGYAEGSAGNTLTWTATDLHNATYEISDGTSIVDSGIWETGVPIVFDSDGYLKGIHDFTITVYDTSGNYNTDTIRITVTDETPPAVSSPSANIEYVEGSTGNYINWTMSDNYPNQMSIYRDSQLLYSLPWSSGLVEIGIDGLSLGLYNYTILVTDDSGNSESDTVMVNVIDSTDPTIDSPPDITYPEGSLGNTIEWIGVDLHPYNYSIYRNDVATGETGIWISSATISINIDGELSGSYNYTIILSDTSGNLVNDTVTVKVTSESVFVDVPEDVFYIVGATGNELSWTVSDVNPDKYIIYREDVEIASGVWINEIPIVEFIDGLGIGVYNFTIYVNDTDTNFITDLVWVTVSDMPEWISEAADTTFSEGTPDHFLEWNSTDLAPDKYEIYQNGSLVDSGIWDNATLISYNITDLILGFYEFQIFVNDTVGNTINSTVWVTVTDNDKPIISGPPPADGTFAEGSFGNTITWTFTDTYNTTYLVQLDGVNSSEFSWNSGEPIVYDLDIYGLTKGTYSFNIIVFDSSRNYENDTVIIIVTDEDDPIISGPPPADDTLAIPLPGLSLIHTIRLI